MDEDERAQEAREAGIRRGLLAELGIPGETPYRYVETWSPAPGTCGRGTASSSRTGA